MRINERYRSILAYFEKHEQNPQTELQYTNPFELLVAVALSAQCTDKRVNLCTPALFKDFPSPLHLAQASFEQIYPYIQSISFPNNKTKNLIAMGKVLIDQFKGEVPKSIEELVQIPGVGRKTANVIVSVIYGQAAMAVDTHVYRVSKRLGLVSDELKTPLEVERVLVKYIPKDKIPLAHHWLILHGRYVCVARSPKCEECGLQTCCKYFQSGKRKDFTPIPGKKRKGLKTSTTSKHT